MTCRIRLTGDKFLVLRRQFITQDRPTATLEPSVGFEASAVSVAGADLDLRGPALSSKEKLPGECLNETCRRGMRGCNRIRNSTRQCRAHRIDCVQRPSRSSVLSQDVVHDTEREKLDN